MKIVEMTYSINFHSGRNIIESGRSLCPIDRYEIEIIVRFLEIGCKTDENMILPKSK